MESVTLADLRAAARLYADERQAGFLTDASNSLDIVINNAARQARGIVMAQPWGKSYWSLRETFALVSGTASYKIDGTDTTNGSDYQVESLGELTIQWAADQQERVDQLPDAEWERVNGGTWAQGSEKGYRLGATYSGTTWGQAITFCPAPSAAATVSIAYVPSYSKLVNSTDTFVGPEGIGQAIELLTAIQIKGMQDEPTAFLEKQLTNVVNEMGSSAANRNAAYHPKVVDVHPDARQYCDWTRRLPHP